MHITHIQLFQTTKIQTFESNSQQLSDDLQYITRCFRLQRYKLLKAIHNHLICSSWRALLFQTTKIQTFESNSQLNTASTLWERCCFRLQRYKLLKAIHNLQHSRMRSQMLFQTTKIQTFESNSQRASTSTAGSAGCFRLQRYKLLKAIHNIGQTRQIWVIVVSDYKDTNF